MALVLTSCSKNKTIARLPSEVKWQTAENYFNRGRYTRAMPYYQQLVFEKSSVYTADAQFKLGECYFRRKSKENLVDAIFEYQEMLRLFPEHRLAPDAQFRIGEAYAMLSLSPEFTQDESERAIENFTRFIEKYPQDSRVAEAYRHIANMQLKIIEKKFLTGYIYFKMKDYPASQHYLNEIISLGNRNELEKKSVFYNAIIHIERREKSEAIAAIEHLDRHFPNSRETKRAHMRFKRIDNRFYRFIYSI